LPPTRRTRLPLRTNLHQPPARTPRRHHPLHHHHPAQQRLHQRPPHTPSPTRRRPARPSPTARTAPRRTDAPLRVDRRDLPPHGHRTHRATRPHRHRQHEPGRPHDCPARDNPRRATAAIRAQHHPTGHRPPPADHDTDRYPRKPAHPRMGPHPAREHR